MGIHNRQLNVEGVVKLKAEMCIMWVLVVGMLLTGCATSIIRNDDMCGLHDVGNIETLTWFHIKINDALFKYGLTASYSGNLAHSGVGVSIPGPAGMNEWMVSSLGNLRDEQGDLKTTVIGLKLVEGRDESALKTVLIKGRPVSVLCDGFYDVANVDRFLRRNDLPSIKIILSSMDGYP
jgi:hypothetical protein